jgi:hypothetical protein
MKTRILNFFKYDRSFFGGRTLYLELGNNLRFKGNLCLHEESYIKDVLFDQLRQMAGLTSDQFRSVMRVPVVKTPVWNGLEIVERGPEYNKGTTEEVAMPVTAIRNSVEPDKIEPVPLPAARLKEEFRFLQKPDCPDELIGLVADFTSAIIAFNGAFGVRDFTEAYIDSSLGLKPNTEDSRKILSIGEELDYHQLYLKKKGNKNHVDFSSRVSLLELPAVTYLFSLKKRLIDNISQNKKNLKKDPTHPKNPARLKRHQEMRREHAIVSLMLDS